MGKTESAQVNNLEVKQPLYVTAEEMKGAISEVKENVKKRAKSVQHSMKVVEGHIENIKEYLDIDWYNENISRIREAKARYINKMYGL